MQPYGYDHHHHDNPLDGASPAVIEIYHMLAHIINNQEKFVMATQVQLDQLTADVKANTDATAAASAALTGFVATVSDLTAKLQAAIAASASAVDPAITAAATALEANNA